MSTLKKNKRIKRAKKMAIYGDLKPGTGNAKVESGKPKYLGGNGRKTRSITARTFKRNLQTIRVMEDGKVVKRRVPVSMIRSGQIQKAVVREAFSLPESES
ncbi:large ribosomal subunit protein bL28 [Calycomorphotria hydatis]|nr:L28 family ribosomal protein [Calycomorphotria hydatis]